MKNVISKNQKYDNLCKYLIKIASKVDFFNTRNQKRLDIQKRKVFVDLGIIRI